MSYFRNMDQPESTNIKDHPAYNTLSDANRKEVNTVYESVYAASQRHGLRIASGMAYEAAKRVIEAYGVSQQANVPQAHPLTKHSVSGEYGVTEPKSSSLNHTFDKFDFGGPSPSDEFDHAGHKQANQADHEDEGAREQQVKNHVATDGSGNIKEDDGPTHDCPGCGSADHLDFHPYDFGHDSETGYHDAGERFHCTNCGEKGDAEDTLRKKKLKEGKEHKFSDIDHGDSVSYKTPQGQIRRGTAHIQGDGGSHWVLRDSSKSGGTGSIVNAKNFHGVTKRGKKVSGSKALLVYGPGGKKQTNEDAEVIALAAGYITRRATSQGLLESKLDEADSRKYSHEDFLPHIKKAGYEYKSREDAGPSRYTHTFVHPKTGHKVSLHSNKSGGGNAEASHSEGGMSNKPGSFAAILAAHANPKK